MASVLNLGADLFGKNAFAFETLTVSSVAKQCTSTVYTTYVATSPTRMTASYALISVDGTVGTDGIRITFDGTAPVAGTTGHLVGSGDSIIIAGTGKIANLKMIRNNSTDTKVQITYFGG